MLSVWLFLFLLLFYVLDVKKLDRLSITDRSFKIYCISEITWHGPTERLDAALNQEPDFGFASCSEKSKSKTGPCCRPLPTDVVVSCFSNYGRHAVLLTVAENNRLF